ncbi:hypothetical protein [Taklimakanibacter lacteus]|uniref:hypothetical protein n=1 Tax=Taklimakanibacter lacteus TaxID=2268456 RepID=UPI000E6740AE
MQAVEQAAYLSVGRACGFGALAIFCSMVGLSYDPNLAARSGGLLTMLMTAILVMRALSAPRRPYAKTETWLMLEVSQRPSAHVAQQVIGLALRDAYFWYARSTATVAALLLVTALVLPFLVAMME